MTAFYSQLPELCSLLVGVGYTEAIGASAERSHCCRGNERPSLIAAGSSLNPPPSKQSHGLTNPDSTCAQMHGKRKWDKGRDPKGPDR